MIKTEVYFYLMSTHTIYKDLSGGDGEVGVRVDDDLATALRDGPLAVVQGSSRERRGVWSYP